MADGLFQNGKRVHIQDCNSGSFLSVEGVNAVIAGRNSPTETWILYQVTGTYWKLENVGNHRHLQAEPNDHNVNSRNVNTWPHAENPNQALWRFEVIGDGVFVITNVHFDRQLEVGSARTNDNANVNLWQHSFASAPKHCQWRVVPAT